MKQNLVSAFVGALAVLAVAGSAAAQSMPGAERQSSAREGFGATVAVNGDQIIIGEAANQASPGYVYAYERDASGSWTQAARLSSPDATDGDGFGGALAVDGDLMATSGTLEDGGTAVYVFRREGGAWSMAQRIPMPDSTASGFGTAMALSGDRLLVGAFASSDTTGTVFSYRRDGSGKWTQTGTLEASDGAAKDRFGVVLALEGDLALVSATRSADQIGATYVFRATDAGWTEEGKLAPRGVTKGDRFGSSLLIKDDIVLVGTERVNRFVGSVYAFQRDEESGEWAEAYALQPFDAIQQTRFGVSMRDAGDELWIGAMGVNDFAGSIYRFTRNANGGWASASKLAADDLDARDLFGSTFDVDGDLAAVSALNSDFGLGSVYVFTRNAAGDWTTDTELYTASSSKDAVVGGQVDCAEGVADEFPCSDIDLVAFVPVSDLGGTRGVNVNDIWGWTDPETGHEWALVGRMDGTAFVDVTDAENPIVVANLPKTPGSISAAWRDVKVYDDHAYIVADGAGQHGMQVYDLRQLRDLEPGPRGPVEVEPTTLYTNVASVHNIVINTETGFAYAVGSGQGGETCGGGLHMIDITTPDEPTFAGCFADASTGRQKTGYSHDAQCVVYHGPDADYEGREICLGSNETALSIADVTDKKAPVAVAMATYPNVGYTHQGWFDEEQRFFYMDDELDEMQGLVDRTRTLIWDLSDLDDPILVKEHMGTQPSIDHNLYIKGNLMYQSNYTSGLRILDISDRTNPVEVAFFDTVAEGDNDPVFNGSWSNYPYFKSGTIVVTSGSEGLFVLKKREGRPVS